MKNIPLEIEHIVPKSRGGTNRVSNLTISCNACNLEKGNKTAEEFGFLNVQKQAKKSLKGSVFMNVINKRIAKLLDAKETYGYVTKRDRIKLGLKKSHVNDAFVVANGRKQERCRSFKVRQVRRNNRCLQINRKGFKPSIRKQRYSLQPFDLIKSKNQLYRSKGTFGYGKYCLVNDLNGNLIKINGKRKYLKTEEIELISYGKGLQFILK